MACYVSVNGKYHLLAGNKIAKNGKLLAMKNTDSIVINKKSYPLGFRNDIPLPEINVPVLTFPDLNGPVVTEESLKHVNSGEPVFGAVWYMTPEGAGKADGSSWENAWSASQIRVALLTIAVGDRIYMSEGDYGDLTRPLSLPEGVSVYGGFVQEAPAWETRDAFGHPTIWNGDGTFNIFERQSEASLQVFDGLTLNDFVCEFSETIQLANMVLGFGGCKIAGGLTNCKANSCSLEIGGNADRLLITSDKAVDCVVAGTLSQSTIALAGGTLSAGATSNIYADRCNMTVDELLESECVDSNITSAGAVRNVKCYGGSIMQSSECVSCTVRGDLMSSGDCFDCQVSGNITSGGNCSKCHGGKIAAAVSCSNCTADGNISSGSDCFDCQVSGNITSGGNCSNCAAKNIFAAGTCAKCVCTETISASDCQNCSSAGLIADSVSDCLAYGSVLSVGKATRLTAIDCVESGEGIKLSNDISFYLIKNGKLYMPQANGDVKGFIQIDRDSGWTQASGSFGIKNGCLYSIAIENDVPSITQIDMDRTWTQVSGDFGIKNGCLYRIAIENDVPSITQIDMDCSWTNISGQKYGIKGGRLFRISNNNSLVQIGTGTDWSQAPDFYYENATMYGIRSGRLYAIKNDRDTQIGVGNTWEKVSGACCHEENTDAVSWTSEYDAYAMSNGFLYKVCDNNVYQIGSCSNWTDFCSHFCLLGFILLGIREGKLFVYDESAGDMHQVSGSENYTWYKTSLSGAVGRGVFFSMGSFFNGTGLSCSVTDSILVNYNGGLDATNSRIFNSFITNSRIFNSLTVNSDGNLLQAEFSTIANHNGDLLSGSNNVYFNSSGSIADPTANAQSAYDVNNLLTLEHDNLIAKFTNTGFFPAVGVQDCGSCPNPETAPEDYAEYLAAFGNWHPRSDSFLVGKGTFNENYPIDLDGTVRSDRPAPGAYEPKITE